MITLKLFKKFFSASIVGCLTMLLVCEKTYTMEPPPQRPPSRFVVQQVLKKLKSILDKPSEETYGFHGYNDLMFALILGDEENAKRIVESDKTQVLTKNNNGMTPLHFAAGFSSVSMIQCLLDNGADSFVNTEIPLPSGTLYGPLDLASLRRNFEPAVYLISRGAKLKEQCLLTAIRQGNIATVYHFLRHGAVWGEQIDFKPLLDKISDLQLRREMTRLLAMFGVPIESEMQLDPLQNAARCGQLAEVQRLLSGGRYVPRILQNYFAFSSGQLGIALTYALYRHPHIARLLLHLGAQIYDVEPIVEAFNQRQLFKRAAYAEFERANRDAQDAKVKKILENKKQELKERDLRLYEGTQPIIDARDNQLFHDLFECHEYQPANYFRMLPPHIFRNVLAYRNGQLWGAQHNNPERVTKEQNLVTAVRESDLATVRLLLSQGANASACCLLTHEPLLQSAFSAARNSELIEILLAHGAYPNPELNDGTCLFDFLARSYSLRPPPGTVASINALLLHWDQMDHIHQSDYALAFRLQLWLVFLMGQDEAPEHCESLLSKIDTFGRDIVNQADKIRYYQHRYDQILQFYDFFMKRVLYHEAQALSAETDLFLNYDGVMDVLLTRWPHVGVQIVRLLSRGSERAQALADFLKPLPTNNPKIIREVEHLYHCFFDMPQANEEFDTLFFSYRDIIAQLLDKWPHKLLALRLAVRHKILSLNLLSAAQKGDIDQVNKWLDEGADPNKCKFAGDSLMEFLTLHQSCGNNAERERIIKIIKILLDRGAQGNPTRAEGIGLLERLVTHPEYSHFIGDRTPLVTYLLNELERRGQQYPQLRMRLQGINLAPRAERYSGAKD